MLIQRLKAIESFIGDTNLMDLTTEWTKKRKKEQEEESSEGKFPNDSKKITNDILSFAIAIERTNLKFESNN